MSKLRTAVPCYGCLIFLGKNSEEVAPCTRNSRSVTEDYIQRQEACNEEGEKLEQEIAPMPTMDSEVSLASDLDDQAPTGSVLGSLMSNIASRMGGGRDSQ